MATIEQMEKKRSRQVVEILTAVHALVAIANELKAEVADLKAEIAELKADIGRTDEVELKAEFDETVDRTDEILAEIRSTALDIGQQTAQASKAIGSMADEIVNLKADIAELQSAITQPPTSRRTKK